MPMDHYCRAFGSQQASNMYNVATGNYQWHHTTGREASQCLLPYCVQPALQPDVLTSVYMWVLAATRGTV